MDLNQLSRFACTQDQIAQFANSGLFPQVHRYLRGVQRARLPRQHDGDCSLICGGRPVVPFTVRSERRFWVKSVIAGALCGSALFFGIAHANNYSVEVQAEGQIRELLEAHLDIVRYQVRDDIQDADLDFLIDRVAEQAAGLLSTKGYFKSNVKVLDARTGRVLGTDAQALLGAAPALGSGHAGIPDTARGTDFTEFADEGKPKLLIRVELGPQVKISSAQLSLDGLIKTQDKNRAGALEFDWSLQEDEGFTQNDWALAKTLLLRKIRSDAYAAARFKDTQALIDVPKGSAQVAAVLDSGPYFTLGDVEISGLKRYREGIVRNINTIEVGEAYNRQKLLDYQKSLQDLPYFSNVVVDIDASSQDAQLTPIKVAVTELPSSSFSGLVGYGTDAGYRANTKYNHYNVFRRGWIYEASYDWQKNQQITQMSLSTPQNKRHYQWTLSGKIDLDQQDAVPNETYQVGLHYAKKLARSSISYNIDYYESTLQEQKVYGWVPSVDWSHYNVDSLAYPRRGYSIETSIGGGAKRAGSTADFVRTALRYRHFFPFFKRDSLAFRAQLGVVNTPGNAYYVPLSLLFEAGGSGSLRGYAYNSIGNPTTQAYGEHYPAQYMALGSAEYTHWFSESWGWAVFYDVGSVTDDLSNRPIYHGGGLGARWRSPVGPIQLDLAYGYPRKKLAPHISIGILF